MRPRRRHGALSVRALAAVLALAIAAGCATTKESKQETAACQGVTGLCEHRLDEVVFAGTHNSFAASNEPGWRFANQNYGLKRQLQDGIRALLLDVHYGVYDPAGRAVRTDLAAEGSDRNKVRKALPALALQAADGIAGRVGLGKLSGSPKLYLCHTLCELGSEPLDRELGVLREFLAKHPREVLIVVVEDYVPPTAIAEAFSQSGLDPYVVTLKRGAPLPTLGALVSENRRLIVFAEEKGGSPSWYMPAFSFIQDTPLGAKQPGQLSCDRYRGESDSPLLLVNHWIPPFPPNPTVNAAIGKAPFLRARLTRCMHARGTKGAIVAVDFFQRTAAVAVAKELNERG
jgi:hypothetical protein